VHRKFGKLPWRDVVMPAARLASRGFVLDAGLARSLTREVAQAMKPYPASVAAYGKRGAAGAQWEPGDTIVLRDLGRTLTAIATRGADVFYTGWIADSIAADMRRNGGLITKQDLAAYRARERAPVRGSYHGYDLVTMPPPSSGGVAMVEMLNILSHFDLQKEGRWSPETLHLVIEAMRRAYVDRARYLGDPDFVKMPLARLTSASYAATLASGIDRPRRPTAPNRKGHRDRRASPPRAMRRRNSRSSTVTAAPSRIRSRSRAATAARRGARAGVPAEQRDGDFNKKPGETNVRATSARGKPHPAGKRMLSSMTPTIVTRTASCSWSPALGWPHDHQHSDGSRAERWLPE
jgi:gamma-glutamyltranspeptidase/glutathione hydrolase